MQSPRWARSGGIVDLGGNVLVYGRPPRGQRWIIGVRRPRTDGSLLATIAIDSGAVATSGDYEHFFRIAGRRYGHLIDPATGAPRRGVIAATAIGPRGEWSDGLSTTMLLPGPGRGRAIVDSLPGASGIWVLDPGRRKPRKRDVVLSRRSRSTFTHVDLSQR